MIRTTNRTVARVRLQSLRGECDTTVTQAPDSELVCGRTIGETPHCARPLTARTLRPRRASMSDTAFGGVVLINVFTVERDNQQRLVDLLVRATEGFVGHAPGFIAATLHRSLDGTKVTMYARWQSNEHYQAMRRDPGPLPFLEEALTYASSEPGMSELFKRSDPPHTK